LSKPDYLLFANPEEWRQWLEKHHATVKDVWILLYKKKYRDLGMWLNQAVEEALCFGWIDSTLKSMDKKTYALRFSPRKRNSPWAWSNIQRAEKLVVSGKMTDAGHQTIAEAKENGAWDNAIQREQTNEIPKILLTELRQQEGALVAYKAIKNSRKKQLLYWLESAKRETTKKQRIQAIIDEALELANSTEEQ
jgi:uncharacterized protein YdeI (YjbR/CyaY-like superfamily)